MFEQSGAEICNENVFVGNFGQEETQQFAQRGAQIIIMRMMMMMMMITMMLMIMTMPMMMMMKMVMWETEGDSTVRSGGERQYSERLPRGWVSSA